MKVRIRTNIDPWDDVDTGLKFDTDYEVDQVIVHGWSTDVYLVGFENPFNSAIFEDKFQEALDEAIDWFDNNPEYDHCKCFIKDYV